MRHRTAQPRRVYVAMMTLPGRNPVKMGEAHVFTLRQAAVVLADRLELNEAESVTISLDPSRVAPEERL